MTDFGRRHRLVASRRFREVFGQRNLRGGRYFTLYQLPNDVGVHRLGLAVSRKVSRSAVGRNRIKRQVRESFRRYREGLAADPEGTGGIDFVVVARPLASGTENSELRRDLDRLWRLVN